MGYKKVMVLAKKVCSSRFRNTPDFYSYLNYKGLYGSPKSKILFFGTPCINVGRIGLNMVNVDYKCQFQGTVEIILWLPT